MKIFSRETNLSQRRRSQAMTPSFTRKNDGPVILILHRRGIGRRRWSRGLRSKCSVEGPCLYHDAESCLPGRAELERLSIGQGISRRQVWDNASTWFDQGHVLRPLGWIWLTCLTVSNQSWSKRLEKVILVLMWEETKWVNWRWDTAGSKFYDTH